MEILNRLRNTPENTETLPYVISRRVAYVVSHSYPFSSNGYAVRTHGVAQGLQKHGYSVVVFNRPGRPWDLEGFPEGQVERHHEIDGVRYVFFRKPSTKHLTKARYLTAATEELKNAFRVFKPIAVIAASDWSNALPAAVAARELGLPFYYEVRGFWELSRAAAQPALEQSDVFEETVSRETEVAILANTVFTLNRFMREELVRRGVEGRKIELIPNGHGELPKLQDHAEGTRAALGIETEYVLGYIGSFAPYEGLEDLIRACAGLRAEGVDASVLLIGSGSSLNLAGPKGGACELTTAYRKLAKNLGISAHVHMPGRVPPGDLPSYYSLIDLFVIPRRPVAVTRLVSPIKPLEALAYGKTVIVSDVEPLAELANEVETMRTFRSGDVEALKQEARELLNAIYGESGKQQKEVSRQFVSENYQWDSVVTPVVSGLWKVTSNGRFDSLLPVEQTNG